jgi:hypothetical protein
VSDELDSIGISIVLDNDVLEGMRRIGRDMAIFNRQTEETAAQMSRIARMHLGAFMPPEPERPKPRPVILAAIQAPAKPATEPPQAPPPVPTSQAPYAPSVIGKNTAPDAGAPRLSQPPAPPPPPRRRPERARDSLRRRRQGAQPRWCRLRPSRARCRCCRLRLHPA